MKILMVVNPSASSVTPRTQVVIQKALSADHDVVLAETNRRGHAARLSQDAATKNMDMVVVLGGDGTLNEAANGLAGTETALAALPGGSTNVFARTLGLPDDAVEATSVLLEAIDRSPPHAVGLGSVNGRYFLFHAGLGYDAAVVAEVEKRDQLKRYASHPLFVYSAVATWLRHYDRRRPAFSVRFADGSVVSDGRFAICLNTNPYTYLGSRPLDLAPEATLDRALVMITFRSLRLLRMTRLAVSALRSPDGLKANKAVDYRTDISEFWLEGHRPFPYQVDGDYLGEVTSLHFRHEPDALRLVVPDPTILGDSDTPA
ncbi:MAG: diacylglycerol/lipid kinase family protein [Acidimicrobiales bacterium]